MKRLIPFLAVFCLAFSLRASVLPAEKLLPADTLFFVTAPDSAKLRSIFGKSPQSRFWNDPAMKPFREHFQKQFTTEVLETLEKELGIKFADYEGMAQGQFTFALLLDGWKGEDDKNLGKLLLIDSREKSESLKTNLANLRKKWADAGKEIKTDKIHGVEFSTLVTSEKDMDTAFKKVFPGSKDKEDDEPAPSEKVEFIVGQSGSLLIVGNSTRVIEKILIKQSGGLVPVLADEPAYEANHNALFRDAHLFAWLNIRPLMDAIKASSKDDEPQNPFAPKPEAIMSALGLDGLKSAAFSYTHAPEGGQVKFFIGAPESSRKGIMKLLATEAKDSAPPAFVPADAVKFSRWRLNLSKAFTSLETMLGEITPAASGAFKLIFESAGKDQDPNYDLRKELIANLGDDIVSYQKAPRGSTLAELSSPPSLTLISSPAPEKLAAALKIAMSSFGQAGPDGLKDREFLGRKIYSMPLPAAQVPGQPKQKPKSFHFAASGGYIGLTTDEAMLEEYIRSSESSGKSLAETAGLSAAAQKIGGFSTGMFAYENQAEGLRALFEMLKKNGGDMAQLFGASTLSAPGVENPADKFKAFADFSLLPAFDSVAKYFYFTTYTGGFDADGFTVRIFTPTPPGLGQ